jgi:hypothetical protein
VSLFICCCTNLQRSLEMARASRKLAAEARVNAAYEMDDFVKRENERIRIAVIRDDLLRYIDKNSPL